MPDLVLHHLYAGAPLSPLLCLFGFSYCGTSNAGTPQNVTEHQRYRCKGLGIRVGLQAGWMPMACPPEDRRFEQRGENRKHSTALFSSLDSETISSLPQKQRRRLKLLATSIRSESSIFGSSFSNFDIRSWTGTAPAKQTTIVRHRNRSWVPIWATSVPTRIYVT
ncbi:hypothetical protein AA313_de0205072 [Arthrobotrys entomopaga]|nr:hypothetical protein AA313_de0205072 [Arthrobotrys entomopaga]